MITILSLNSCYLTPHWCNSICELPLQNLFRDTRVDIPGCFLFYSKQFSYWWWSILLHHSVFAIIHCDIQWDNILAMWVFTVLCHNLWVLWQSLNCRWGNSVLSVTHGYSSDEKKYVHVRVIPQNSRWWTTIINIIPLSNI